MPNLHPLFEAFARLRITPWTTWDEGPTRERAFPHSVVADYDGTPSDIRYGAFLGWVEGLQWWADLANRLSLHSFDQLDLLDIEHQAGGHSCIAWSCVASPVAIHGSCVGFAGDLCRHYFHAHGGWMNGDVREEEQYRKRLATVGLTANCLSEHGGLIESVYPFDATDGNLASLLSDPRKALSDLAPLSSDATARERLRIYILADNSD